MTNYIFSYGWKDTNRYIGVMIIRADDRISAINSFDENCPGMKIFSIVNGSNGHIEYSEGTYFVLHGKV